MICKFTLKSKCTTPGSSWHTGLSSLLFSALLLLVRAWHCLVVPMAPVRLKNSQQDVPTGEGCREIRNLKVLRTKFFREKRKTPSSYFLLLE